jgi:acyl carrier protein
MPAAHILAERSALGKAGIVDDLILSPVARKVIAEIARSRRMAPEAITMDTTLEELQLDSLDGLNLFFELEEAFDLTIPDDEARSMRSVRQIVEAIERLQSGRGTSGGDAAAGT